MQVGLCISESYYIQGHYRIEYFENLKQLEGFRKNLDQSTTTWVLGEKVPKRRSPTQWT